MKIGFLMGSFDPVHIGHVNMIRVSLNFLDKVVVVPSGHNPWKKNEPAPFKIRVEMILEAIRPFGKAVEVSDIEGTFEPPFYSNKPLGYFKEKYKNDDLFIICGEDTVNKIPKWKDAETDILPFYSIVEIPRFNSEKLNYDQYNLGKTVVYPLNGIAFNVSSTSIRELVANNKQTYPLISESVRQIIDDNKLYQK